LEDLVGVRDEGLDGTGFEDEVGTDEVRGGEGGVRDLRVAKVDDAAAAAAGGRAGWVLRIAVSGAGRRDRGDGAGRGGGGVTTEKEECDRGGGAA